MQNYLLSGYHVKSNVIQLELYKMRALQILSPFNKGLNNFSKIKLAKRLKKACFAYLTIFVKIIVAIFIDIR